jgi:glycosyltransferase involved in cell wall biosynthesis
MYLGIKELVAKIYQEFQFDLIHAHVALPDGYAGMKVAQKYKKSLIVTIHGQDFQQTIFKSKKCKRNIEKVINFSEKTIVVSKKLKKIGEKYLQVNNNKMIVVPNGINIDDIYTEKSKISQEYHGRKIILSVSHLIKTKGIDLNLKVISKLKRKYPNIIYLIIGEGKEKKNLEDLVNKLNLQNIVKFIGEVSHHKVMKHMAACDIFSLPSWNEGFGVVYLEAMAHGKPVIGCQGEGIEDFVEDGKTGILVFDRYGTYLKTIPFKNLNSFQVFNDKIIYQPNDSILKTYNIRTIEETSMKLPQKNNKKQCCRQYIL